MRTKGFQSNYSKWTSTMALVLFFAVAIPYAHAEKVDPSKSDPLEMFGLTAAEATVDKVKMLWRSFATENHPDKFLVEMEQNENLRHRIEREARRLSASGEDPLAAYVKATKAEKDRRTNEFIQVSNANEGLVLWLAAGKRGRPRSNSGARRSPSPESSAGRQEHSATSSDDHEAEQERWQAYQKRNGAKDRGSDFDYFGEGDVSIKFQVPKNDPHYDSQNNKLGPNYSYDAENDIYTEHYTSLRFKRDPRFDNEYVNTQVGMYLNVDLLAREATIYDPGRHAIYSGAIQGWLPVPGPRVRKFIPKSWETLAGSTGSGEVLPSNQTPTKKTARGVKKSVTEAKPTGVVAPAHPFLILTQENLINGREHPLSVSSTGHITGVWSGDEGFGFAPRERDWKGNPPSHRTEEVILAIVAGTKGEPYKRMYAELQLRNMDDEWDRGRRRTVQETLATLRIAPYHGTSDHAAPCDLTKLTALPSSKPPL